MRCKTKTMPNNALQPQLFRNFDLFLTNHILCYACTSKDNHICHVCRLYGALRNGAAYADKTDSYTAKRANLA